MDTNEDKGIEETVSEDKEAEEIEAQEPSEEQKEVEEAAETTVETEAEEKPMEEPTDEAAEAAKSEEMPVEVKEEIGEIEERKKEEAFEEDIVEERFYTIPLGKAWISPRKKRVPKAVRIVRSFLQRHMKIEEKEGEEEAGRLVISNEVNERLWSRGIQKPPRRIKVRAVKDKEGTITLYLAEGD